MPGRLASAFNFSSSSSSPPLSPVPTCCSLIQKTGGDPVLPVSTVPRKTKRRSLLQLLRANTEHSEGLSIRALRRLVGQEMPGTDGRAWYKAEDTRQYAVTVETDGAKINTF